MARTISEIKQEIINAKNSQPSLSDLNNTSKTSIFNLWAYITAVSIHILETFFDRFKEEVNETIDKELYGKLSWYPVISKEFQLDHQLNHLGEYYEVDEDARIISRSSVKENSEGVVVIKVAKGEEDSLSALSEEEKKQFENYIEKKKIAGTRTQVITLNADKLRLEGEIFYDGIHSKSTVQNVVKEGLQEYMKNLPFDGVVRKNDIIDSLQSLKSEGVLDIVISKLIVRTGEDLNVVEREFETVSGYIIEDDLQNLLTNLTFTPILKR